MTRKLLEIRIALGVAFGFAAGLALTTKVIEGGETDWTETGLLGWGIMVGTAIGVLIGGGVQRWLERRLTTQTMPWVLLGLALGSLCVLVTHTVLWDMGSSFLGVSRGIAAIGLWNGVLLGIAFGNRSSTANAHD